MKILHIIDHFQPILGYQETYLAKTQKEKGYNIQIITSDRYASILYKGNASKEILGNRIKFPGRYNEEGLDVIRLSSWFEFLDNFWLKTLERSIIDFEPDMIHVHGILSITAIRVALLKKKIKNTRLIYDDHMTFNAMRGKWVYPLYKLFKLLFGKIILKNADGIVAVTDETKLFMNKMYGFPLEKVSLIPLGCDTSRFYREEKIRMELRRKFLVADNDVVFCYVGKVIHDKGVDILIDASIELMKSGNKIVILCVGGKDPEYFKCIKRKIDSSGFENRFIFLPALQNKELYQYYSIADVGVWPKQCSITMLEAMACSLPVIISDNSGATEGVASNGSGFIYKEGDIGDLKTKMKTYFDIKIRKRMSENARKVAERYNWKSISHSFELLYNCR